MAAEVDARSEVSQVLEERDLVYEDFAEGGALVGVGISLPKGNEIDSDGACDEVADDSALVYPNREAELECFGNGNVEIDAEPKIENENDPKFCVSGENVEQNLVTEEPFEDHDLGVEKSSTEGLDKDAQGEYSIYGDKGAELPSSADENIGSSTSMPDDLVLSNQNIPEGNRQLENTVMASSIVMVGSVEINCKKVSAIKSFHFFPAVENIRLDMKVKSSSESIDNHDCCSLQGTKIEAKSENETVDEDTQSSCLSTDKGNLNHVSDVNEIESNGSTRQEVEVVDEINCGSSFGTLECSTRDTEESMNVVSDVGSEPAYFVRSSSYEEDTQSSCFSNDQGSINHEFEVNEVESNGSTCQEVEVIGEINWDLSFETHSATLDTAEPLNAAAEVGSGGPFYFVRIPRYEDEFIQEKIKHAQSLLDEKTQIRDSFRDQIQTTKAACKELSSNLSAAKAEARAARESLKLKRKEIEAAKSMINKAKDAIYSDEIGIRLLRKEMDLIKADVLKADELTASMLNKYDGEKEKYNGLRAESEEANKIRQEAYVDLQCLKKPFDDKRKYFRKYKNDIELADNLALRKDVEKLQAHAINQVETFMERWNNDDEFRRDYIRCNARSTLRRLGTFDGRSLASDKDGPALDNVIKEIAAADDFVSPGLTVEENKPAGPVETLKDDQKPAKRVKKKKQKTKTKNPVAAVTTLPDDQESVSGGAELADTKDSSGLDFGDTREKDKRSKEEEEQEKRAEELRKEEEAIRLQEQLKLEEKAKAEIALARKKRKAERAQARAAIRAQKEAEEKEKEKEKKARRKKKKKAAAGGEAETKADIEEEPQPEPAVSEETPTDTPEIAEKSKTTPAKSQKRPQPTKQNKAKAIIPPPLRKWGKRKMEMWVWILVAVMIVLTLFFLGNGGYLGKLGMGRFSW